jgi:hypothetical protein
VLISIEDIGNDFYTYGGYNEWAESNNIIVVYPQAVKSEFLPMNPSGCFDWWGYTDANVSTAANLFGAINVGADIPQRNHDPRTYLFVETILTCSCSTPSRLVLKCRPSTTWFNRSSRLDSSKHWM